MGICNIFTFLIVYVLSRNRGGFVVFASDTLIFTRNNGSNHGKYDYNVTKGRPQAIPKVIKHRQPETQPESESTPRVKSHSDNSDSGEIVAIATNLINLDLIVRRETTNYQYFYNPITKADIFTVKSPFLFKTVTLEQEVLWFAKNGHHSDKVIVFKDSEGRNRLDVYLYQPPRPKPRVSQLPIHSAGGIELSISSPPKHKSPESTQPRFRPYPSASRGGLPKHFRRHSTYPYSHPNHALPAAKSVYKPPKQDFRPQSAGHYELPPNKLYQPNKHSSVCLTHDVFEPPKDICMLFMGKSPGKKFETIEKGSSVRYEFNPAFRCVQVKVDETLLWQHRDGHEYPVSAEYFANDGILNLEFHDSINVYVTVNGKWYFRV